MILSLDSLYSEIVVCCNKRTYTYVYARIFPPVTRAEYLETLADCRMVIDMYELAPMTFAACPGKVSRALQRWATATDEERAEAGALNEPRD